MAQAGGSREADSAGSPGLVLDRRVMHFASAQQDFGELDEDNRKVMA